VAIPQEGVHVTAIEANKAVVERLFNDDLNEPDGPTAARVADQIIAPDFVDHTNPPELKHGLESHKTIVALFRSSFPDMHWTVEDVVAEGDRVVARTTMRGTHRGEFFGLAPTGRPVVYPGIHVLRLADGKVAEHWGSNDDLGLMRQLGAPL
jgi:predicted ester cyclase